MEYKCRENGFHKEDYKKLFEKSKKERKYPSHCCQKCGESIGWLGRFIEWIFCGLIKHDCNEKLG